MATFHLLSFGVFIHVIFLFAIFDIYFKSPVINGITPVNNTIPPTGKRVILISVDGLRLDSLYDGGNIKDLMPHVKNVMETRGTWGVSESHVPTESRPGHVAMLAGFYEDPSAVTRGWKENPVTFDSIFNQSVCSFAWGSPDILHIFFKGLDKDCAFSYSYENEQNFAGDIMEYDNWVLRQFQKFLETSMDIVPDKHGVLFFLHLLGQDTSGHTHKPHTEKYIQNTKNVDRIIREVEDLITKHFEDGQTTFVLTSDHGMTDWGSHGAGHPNETQTPIVAWGAGVPKPSNQNNEVNIAPVNINQADITPLLAVLLGSSIPVNSVGTLPLEYLDIPDKNKAEAMLLNAKQITSQFQKNLEIIKSQIVPFFHSPFEKLTNEELELMTMTVFEQIKNQNYDDAINKSKVLIEIGLEGLVYYQNYYQRLLLVSISASYVLWVFYLGLELYDKTRITSNESKILKFVSGTCAVVTMILTLVQRLPLQYNFYLLLPQLLLYLCVKKVKKSHILLVRKHTWNLLMSIFVILVGIEVIVGSFFQRYLLSAALVLTFFWPIYAVDVKKSDKFMVSVWILSGIGISAFCLLPIVGGQPNVILIVISGFLLFLFLLLLFLFNYHKENIFVFIIRCLTVAGASWNSAVVHINFGEENELPEFNQIFSWGLFGFALIMLIVGEPYIIERFDHVFISFLVPFLLLSISHEGLFIMFLFIHLRSWIFVEYHNFQIGHVDKLKTDNPTFSDFRRAYFFLLYVWVSFFGLGNVASLNSFDPAWVRCFLTVFHPFTMTALILFKSIIPFMVVTCSMRALTVMLKLRPEQIFIIVLIYCNMMGLHFLYLIRNKGSWLDIGSSISHYVIQQVTIVVLLILYGVAKFFLSYSLSILPENGKFRWNIKSASDEPLMSLPRYYSSYKFHRS